MVRIRLDAIQGVLDEAARRWPGSTLEKIKIGRGKIILLFRINGVRVKAIISRSDGRIRVFSPLKGANITLTRILERRVIRA